MKKQSKILITIVAGIVIAVMLVTAGAYANEKGWFNFTGKEQAAQSERDINEVMAIMRELNEKNITIEQALEELQDLNPSGLAKQNKELRDQIEQLKTDNVGLTTELNAKQKEIDEKNTAYDQLQKERDETQALLDSKNAGYTQLQEELTQANEYIEHLEHQVIEANTAVNSISATTTEAVEEARTYKE